MAPPYEIRSVSGQENQLGIFATKNIKVSDIICNEKPFLEVDGRPSVAEPLKQEVLAQHAANALGGLSDLKHVGAIFESRLVQKAIATKLAGCTSDKRVNFLAKYDALHVGGGSDVSHGDLEGVNGKRLRIFRNNNFTTAKPGSEDESSALFLDISRINHSCSPSAVWSWCAQKDEMSVQAVVKIAARQEIHISYLSDGDLLNTRAMRRSLLESQYGFFCQCSACGSGEDGTESDANRKAIFHSLTLSSGTCEELMKAAVRSTMWRCRSDDDSDSRCPGLQKRAPAVHRAKDLFAARNPHCGGPAPSAGTGPQSGSVWQTGSAGYDRPQERSSMQRLLLRQN
jgi:hypothetical protein